MSSAPSFTEIDFYDYKIRMCMIEGTEMYLVSDLLQQYNEKHGTSKRFKKYLKNKQTQEVIKHMAERVQTVRVPNSDPHFQMFLNDDKWNIPNVIQYITYPHKIGDANQGYIVCEDLLHACLMWADPVFACDIYSFLTRLRKQDNDYLKHQIAELKQRCKLLANRHIPNDDDQQWFYVLSYKVSDNTVHLYSKYRLLKEEADMMKELKVYGLQEIYRVKNLPNGRTFRSMASEPLTDICEMYGGSIKRINYFTIPLEKWNKYKNEIMASIRLQLKQVRIDLGWRTDLNNLNNE